ncbi:glycosyltransferase [Lactococcus garvieae]|jgi:GT2 family glycosyltransferase|uniref:Glycosyltransferase n=1 Tax=Lactococcus garvieae TaxID=1363 RepID=A0AA46YTC2_9LACT|nr:glycosyltransferase [Lactococcus garvieae]UYT10514.1 glycosyltransferase [Lactococcus garvieae]UYT12555.1 glycosyltransferase [Lactococcus garvieae]
MKKIGIVILNYLAYEDTLECVESIFAQDYQDFEIVIVDNASYNASLEILTKKYQDTPQVHIISTSQNIGFAKGNNLGIQYFREKEIYNLLVINGDTILTQNDYLKNLMSLNISNDVAMIGTKIIGRDGKNQNLSNRRDNDLQSIVKMEKYFKRVKLLSTLGIYGIISRLVRTLKPAVENKKEEDKLETQLVDTKSKMLHGSAIFFTEIYLKKYLGFYPDTFLYEEEELLACICEKLSLKQMYVDSLSIYHKEDSSSDMVSGFNKRKEALFKLRYQLENIEILKGAIQMSPQQMRKKMEQ